MLKGYLIAILLLVNCAKANAQIEINSLHYQTRIEKAALYFKDTITNHSSVLPYITPPTPNSNRKRLLCYRIEKKRFQLKTYPILSASLGIESNQKKGARFLYTGGLGAGINIHSKKLFFTAKFLPYTTQSTFVADSVQQTLQQDIGGSRELFTNGYQQNEFLFAYKPNQFFTFSGGNGRNFFGEGYRSLILSDNSQANPFFKIETSFHSIKYVNLYQQWTDNTINPLDKKLDRKKFAAMHYISWNITREFNLSIFESVVWQTKDTLIDRGFDPNYLNPIVFYRPVEYGNGSADNVLLGMNMSFKFNKNHSIYTQLILDDFLLSEIKAHSKWWANKYGFQIGYKSIDFLGKDNLYFQTEFNLVRPFTYSHKHSVLSYGNLNSSAAHPIGANFFEIVQILSYKIKKISITNKITYASYGVDTSAISYGQNIFTPYVNRDGDYDHFIMQGFKKNVLNETLIIETPLLPNIDLHAYLKYNWRMEITPNKTYNNHFISIGIRSRIWNRYTDL